ncbi:MAG: F0F1 ATP synthase subunit A [Kiritimatiellae bacterium]|nr:F0F1 ATP synthase subunit A [Kiritimatiellia bacterium]
MNASRQEQIRAFIEEHVLTHTGSADVWNLPFVHVKALDWFRFDWVMLLVGLAVVTALGLAARRGRGPAPKGWANALEAYVAFIRNHIALPHLGDSAGRELTPYFCTLFLFILVLNLLGLCPLFSTATGCISVTAGLATMFLAVAVGYTLRCRGLRGLAMAFVPHGVPGWLLPMMVPLEVLSLFVRAFALTIRLFANMLAGHILIFALVGMITITGVAMGLPLLAMVVALFFFEIFVGIFQAYIFTLLSAVFTGLMVNPEH